MSESERKSWSGEALAWWSATFNALAPIASTLAMAYFTAVGAAFATALAGVAITSIWFRGLLARNWRTALSLTPLSAVNGAGFLLMFMCLAEVGPVTQSLLSRLYIVHSAIIAHVLLGERLSFVEWVCIVIAFLGGILWTGVGHLDGSTLGVVYGIAFTFFFSLSNALIARRSKREGIPSQLVVTVNYAITALMLAPLAVSTGLVQAKFASSFGIAMFWSFFGALVSVGSLSAMYASFTKMSFAKSNLIRSVSAIIGAAIAWPLFPRPLTALNIAGGVILLVSVLAVAQGSRAKGKHPPK